MIIGLTGSIASGKSTASRKLASLGARVLDADVFSREAVAPGSEGLKTIAERFGNGVMLPDGSLDRRAMAAIVFSNSEKRELLNSIIHPIVLRRLFEGTKAAPPDTIVVWDVPLLLECGWQKHCDRVWLITAAEETRIARIVARDGSTVEAARSRVRSQMSDGEKALYADNVIYNDADEGTFLKSIERLYKETAAANGRK